LRFHQFSPCTHGFLFDTCIGQNNMQGASSASLTDLFQRRDHFDGRERNSGTKLIFRKICGRFWLILIWLSLDGKDNVNLHFTHSSAVFLRVKIIGRVIAPTCCGRVHNLHNCRKLVPRSKLWWYRIIISKFVVMLIPNTNI